MILSYLKTLSQDDEIRRQEIIWHAFNAEDNGFLLQYIIDNYQSADDDKSMFILQEFRKILNKNYNIDKYYELLEYGLNEKWMPHIKKLSSFWGDHFNLVSFMAANGFDECDELINQCNILSVCNHIRLKFRNYPDLLIAVYYIMGRKNENNKKIARKFINKGITLAKKIYTYDEIDKFVTMTVVNSVVCEGGFMSPVHLIYELRSDVEGLPVDIFNDPTDPNKFYTKYKIN